MFELDNGATPVQMVMDVKGKNGVVLAHWRKQYVIWTFYYIASKEKAICDGGDYIDDLETATKRFKERASQFLGW